MGHERGDHMETCVVCGAIIPEGRQVCPICERILYVPRKKSESLKGDAIDDPG